MPLRSKPRLGVEFRINDPGLGRSPVQASLFTSYGFTLIITTDGVEPGRESCL